MDSFSGVEELEVEVWQAEYGTSDLKTLRMFEGVRGVKVVKVSGSVGGGYARWLEGVMQLDIGEEGEEWEGGMGYDLWSSGNR